ncbi:MAG TPA: hypothetical protein VIO57_12990 [Chloroflexota bacterium]|jgi:hypothetical protein
MHASFAPSHDAFLALTPITPGYAVAPIRDGFNWDSCASLLPAGQWYLVVFRSTRREHADDLLLEMYDYGAYIEAQRRASGLLFYFRGMPNERRECLSFCIWESREEAARASRLALHRTATQVVGEMYESFALERYLLRRVAARNTLEFEAVTGPTR